ncbi:MAG: site-specific DNA-methyltransferase [Thermoguttaceae bacterium]
MDPPYNTGSDGFTYRARRFVKEKPDGTPVPKDHPLRHSYWLSFMSKRLELAKNLLSDRGVIFISIDDNEQANLKLLCDRIFREENFVGIFLKQSKVGGGSDSKFIVKEHEYCIVYAKNINSTPEMFMEHDEEYLKRYKEQDENGRFFWDTFARPGLKNPIHYDIIAPDGTVMDYGWIHGKERFQQELKNGIVRIVPKKEGGWSVQFKQYLNLQGKKPRSMTMDFGGSIEGKNDISALFDSDRIFSYPKSVKYIRTLLNTVSDKKSIILDFFAGSGTTLHAVMKLNEEDGGSRQCILIQLNEGGICQYVTYERNRRVMQGYTNSKGEAVPGLGNSLKYYRTAFVGRNPPRRALDSDRLELACKAGNLLALAENTLFEIERTEAFQIFTDAADPQNVTAIYFLEDIDRLEEFQARVEALAEQAGKVAVYIFSWDDGAIYDSMFDACRNVEVKSIPQPILEIYKTLQ